jgi:hypothetical protein
MYGTTNIKLLFFLSLEKVDSTNSGTEPKFTAQSTRAFLIASK